MRIGLIAGEYPPLQGGLGDYTRRLALALADLGHDPHVLTRFVAGAPAVEREGNITVHRLVGAWNWETRRRIEGFNRLFHPDVLNLQYQAAAYQMHPAINLLPGALAKRTPTVVTFHDLRVPYLFPKAGVLRWKSIVMMAKGASACITTNVEDRDTLLREGVREVAMIPIGSNITPAVPEGFDGAAWRRAWGIADGVILVGYFGFMNESKGGEALIRALAELRRRGSDVGLLHIGGQAGDSDPTNLAYAAHLQRLAMALGVRERVYRTGFLDERGVSEAFAACTCIALPYRDGASFRRGTLMAALAHGCAIVTTTPRVALPELIDGANVLLTPPDDVPALAQAIQRVIADEALRRRLQAGAAELSRRFRWEAIAAQTAALLERIVTGG
ncbi:MAG: glycosyl transferase family 1 [Candidatus Roseilinea sp.]|nr:MAG: glycosyl transferase family 1 [Candidatus Roseilinea sp.]